MVHLVRALLRSATRVTATRYVNNDTFLLWLGWCLRRMVVASVVPGLSIRLEGNGHGGG